MGAALRALHDELREGTELSSYRGILAKSLLVDMSSCIMKRPDELGEAKSHRLGRFVNLLLEVISLSGGLFACLRK